jgi:hypothetical protein
MRPLTEHFNFCYQKQMNGASSDNKNPPGRPRTGIGTLIGVRMSSAEIAAVDAWAQTSNGLTRPAAIRFLVRRGLGAEAPADTPTHPPMQTTPAAPAARPALRPSIVSSFDPDAD